MPEERRRGHSPLELCVPDDQFEAASFTPVAGSNGGSFSCLLNELSYDSVSAIERAIQTATPVRLVISAHPILLGHVTIERQGPHSVRILGRVMREEAKA